MADSDDVQHWPSRANWVRQHRRTSNVPVGPRLHRKHGEQSTDEPQASYIRNSRDKERTTPNVKAVVDELIRLGWEVPDIERFREADWEEEACRARYRRGT